MGAKTKQVGGGTATATANNWNQFLNQQLQGGMNQAMNNAQQPGMQQQGFQQAFQGMLGGQGGPDVSGAGGAIQKYFQGGGGGGMADLSGFGTPQTATAGTAQTAQVGGTGMADLSKFSTAAQTAGTGMADMSQFGPAAQSQFNTQGPISSDFTSMLRNMIQGGGAGGGVSAGAGVQLAPGMDYGQAYQTLGQDPLMERNRQRAIAEQRARFGAEGAGALGTGAQYAESNLNAELAAQDASMRRQQAMALMGQNLQERMGAANVGLQGRGQDLQASMAGASNALQNQANMMSALGQARGQDLSTAMQQMQLGAQQGQFNAGQQNAMQQAQMQAQLQNQQMGNQMGQFNTGQQNAMQQAMLNAQLQNQQLGNQFGQFNVGQQNQMNQFNTGQQNQMGQFNAAQDNAMQQAMLQAALQNQQMGNQFGLGMLGQGMNMNQLAAQQQQNALNQMFGAFQQTNQLGTPQAQMVTQPSMLGQLGNAALGLGSAYLGGGGTLGGIARGLAGLFGGGGPSLPAPSASMFMPQNIMRGGGFSPNIPMPSLPGASAGNFNTFPQFMLPPGG